LQKNVLEYLEHTAALYPDKTAFADEGRSLSFGQLLSMSRSMGTALAEAVKRVNTPVIVLSERTAVTVAAFMGVLQSGCCYVPVDASTPIERINAIAETLTPGAILYPAALENVAEAIRADCPRIPFEEGFACGTNSALLHARREQVLDIDPVYLIFTSGSTGTPKGIVIAHRNVIDFTDWFAEIGHFTNEDILGNQAPFYFDLSVKDIYTCLKCGATINIIPKKLFMFPALLVDFLAEHRVTALVWATSAFHLVANSGVLEKRVPLALRTVILGGEALMAKQLNLWRAAYPDVQYINLYGPTEVTVDCTWYPITGRFDNADVIPIGSACRNKEVFLLDSEGKEPRPGHIGELCVRGAGLAKGYFGDWSKTAASFIQDPRNPNYPDIIYRTGDLAVRGEDGLFRFVSRRDGQIKHMGYRIELGEIETAVNSVDGVGETACVFKSAEDKIVCIYTGSIEGKQLAKTLRPMLPKYMIPNIYERLETMPHNPNGKIDRPALKKQYGN